MKNKVKSSKKTVLRLKKSILLGNSFKSGKDTESKYQRLVETMNEGVWVGDKNERTLYANPKFCEMVGYSLEEMRGRQSYDFWTEESAKKVKAINEKERKAGISSSYEGELLTKNGEVIPVLLNGTPLPDGGTIGIMTDLREVKKKEEALRRSEAQYRMLLDTAQEGILLTDADENITFMNPKFAAGLGYKIEELKSKSLWDLLSSKEDRAVLEKQTKSRRKGKRSKYEINLRHRDGSIRLFSLAAAPILDCSGQFIGSLGVYSDLTERVRTEQRYKTIFENTGTATIIIEDDMTISLANTEFEKLSGFKKSIIENKKKWTEFFGEKDLKMMIRYHKLRRNSPHTAPRNYEVRFIPKNGKVRDVYLTVAMIPGTKKSVASILDITERKKSELLMRKLNTAFEQSRDGIAMADGDGDIEFVNSAWAKMHGYKKEELIGKNLSIFHTPEQIKNEVTPFNRTVLKQGAHQGEVGHVRRNGKTFPTFMTTTHLKEGNFLVGVARDITDQKKAEEALRASEEKFRSMINQSMMGVCMFQGTKVVFANKKLANIFGYSSPQDMVGQDFKTFLTPTSYKQAKKLTLSRQKGAQLPELGEYIGVKKNGKKIYVQSFSKRIIIGNQVYSQVLVADVTEKKLMENRLAQHAKEFNVLYRIHSHIIMAHRFSKVLNRIAKDLTQILQHTEVAYAQITFDGKVYQSSRSRHRFVSKIERPLIIEGIQRGKVEIGYRKKLPEIKRHPFTKEERKLIENVARTLQRHVASREVIERFQKVVKRSVTAIYIAEDGILRYVNPRFCKFFQCNEKKLLGLSIAEFISNADVQEKLYKKANLSSIRHHAKGYKADGTEMIFEVFAQKITYQGRPAVLGRLLDITELQQAEKRLRNFNEELKAMVAEKTKHLAAANRRLQSLNELKDEFIAVTSHELRSPLTSIRGYLSFLMDNEVLSVLPESSRKYLLRAYQNTESLNHLVNNILDVSRLDMGRFKLQKKPVDLVRLIKAIMDSLSYQASENNLLLTFDNQTVHEPLTINIDSIRISQVLRNLLDNAIKFSRQGKEIQVRIKKDEHSVYIQVVDQGVGIPKGKMVEIFDKFMQVRNADTRYKGGAGLGLFIAKRIVQLHGGDIMVESEKHKGTVFTIKLPFHG